MTSKNGFSASYIFDWAIKLLYPMVMGVLAWVTVEVVSQGNRITAIETNHYTDDDARRDQVEWASKFSEIKKDLHKIDNTVVEIKTKLENLK
jgi:hypothetical protein